MKLVILTEHRPQEASDIGKHEDLTDVALQGCVAGYVERGAPPARRHLPGHQLWVLRKGVILVCKYPQLPGHFLQAFSSAMSAQCSPQML